ncbi:hypothetical protein CC85DRAFT_1734 [Cutaneotrichosporon oleaginosum]|uniref:Uncharacterized protein n=1 Tax=Cutaneotrichosporon oleaginosum TaxID=879819 RepID=A0A0J0XZF2_9TREE|nr:uncharacterized protein CC85DRAFT_1734 [Cutaneotrichosporon oleaginosum]KLT46415.1 hypothetical protein CC85DRAFT_1734 [Cutaneotrichosporon oleaginosum]TXT15215.1 hypothetical protein COLE_01408 [Cutaneotrichosporon oleaginosum]
MLRHSNSDSHSFTLIAVRQPTNLKALAPVQSPASHSRAFPKFDAQHVCRLASQLTLHRLLDLGGDCSLELRVPNGALALACRLEIALGVAVRADIGLATCLSFDPNIGVVCGNGVGLSHFDSACGQCEMHEWPRMQCICNNRLVDFAVGTFCSSSMVSLRRLR